MNNHEREERRKLQERREDDDDLAKAMPNINRAHRDCERECLDQKARIKALESLLAEAGSFVENKACSQYHYDLINRIDAILPATEVDK